jgi:hypothetical protein
MSRIEGVAGLKDADDAGKGRKLLSGLVVLTDSQSLRHGFLVAVDELNGKQTSW